METASPLIARILELETQADREIERARADADALRGEAAKRRAETSASAKTGSAEAVRTFEASARQLLDQELAELRDQQARETEEIDRIAPDVREAAVTFLLDRLRNPRP